MLAIYVLAAPVCSSTRLSMQGMIWEAGWGRGPVPFRPGGR